MSASKFIPDVAALIERTAVGVSLTDVARRRRREATARTWITRGRSESEGGYPEFVAALDAAHAEAQDRTGSAQPRGSSTCGMGGDGLVQPSELTVGVARCEKNSGASATTGDGTGRSEGGDR